MAAEDYFDDSAEEQWPDWAADNRRYRRPNNRNKNMSEGMNKVTLLGNVGQQPELRFTQSGTAVLNVRLATTERVKKGEDWEDHTEWHDVVIWGKRGESLERILDKGSSILVEGNLRTSSWDDKETGKKRYKTEVHARQVLLVGAPPNRDRGRDDRDRGGRDDRRDDRRERGRAPRDDYDRRDRGGFA